MTNQDDNNQEIEKVEDVEVETTKKTSDSDDKKQNDDEYEKVCYVCHRTESRAGKMINMGNNIYICPDCMQRSFDAIYNSGINYDDMMKMSGNRISCPPPRCGIQCPFQSEYIAVPPGSFPVCGGYSPC